jgi:prepilin-type N-terminal cleavage/methylation domain-containing protein
MDASLMRAEGKYMKISRNMNGFTLLEVVAVLVILGIISVVFFSRISSNQNNLITATDTLTSQLRLAQARAMSTSQDTMSGVQSVWGVRFINTTQYHLFYCATASGCDPTSAANQKIFPGAGSIIMDITNKGVQVTNGALILAFDRFGTPYTNATLTTILAAPLVLNLRDSSGNIRAINITPQTGMITS